jgi:hypothetical protein
LRPYHKILLRHKNCSAIVLERLREKVNLC